MLLGILHENIHPFLDEFSTGSVKVLCCKTNTIFLWHSSISLKTLLVKLSLCGSEISWKVK